MSNDLGLGEELPYSPAFPPNSQDYVVYQMSSEGIHPRSRQSPAVHESAAEGRRRQKHARNPRRSVESIVTLRTGSIGSQDQFFMEKPNKSFKPVQMDADGRLVVGVQYSAVDIHNAYEMDQKIGGGHHATVTEILNKEYLRMQETSENREEELNENVGLDAHPENTGLWIFGAGHGYILPRQFNDSFHKARFIGRIIFVFFTCLVWRCFWLNETILDENVHDKLYDSKVYGFPLLVVLSLYSILSFLLSRNWVEQYIRIPSITLTYFLILEILRTVSYIFFSVGSEFMVLTWFETLDIFEDYDPDNLDDRNHWKRLNVTPPIFLIITAFMVTINIFTALCLELYTDMSLGTPEMFKVTVGTSLSTFILSLVLIKYYSVGIVPMWDGCQVVMGTCLALSKTWIFLYNLKRLVGGKITFIEGMDWKDVIFAAVLII